MAQNKQNHNNLGQVISELRAARPWLNPMERRLKPEEAKWRYQRLRAAVGELYAGCTLENYELYDDRQRAVHERLTRWVENLSGSISNGQGLLLWGPIGTGKDHLICAAMWTALLIHRFDIDWVEGTRLHQRLRHLGDDWESECNIIYQYTQSFLPARGEWEKDIVGAPQILAISDPIPLGRSLAPRGTDVLFSIIDQRYRKGFSTWATLNVTTVAEVEQRAPAGLIDRLRDKALMLKCDWQSMRERRAVRG